MTTQKPDSDVNPHEHVFVYLQLDISAYELARVRMIEQVQDGGDQSLVDAAQLTVDDVL